MQDLVLAEKLKEEIGGQQVLAAVFHSFNFDPEFFENYILPLFLPDIPFGEDKIQNTILWKKFQSELPPLNIYCDFHAKSQKGINLNYTVRSIDLPKSNGRKPCYHPKHSFILLKDWTLLTFSGSNNLTESGWCNNLEGVNFFRLKNKVKFPREFKDQWKLFNRDIRNRFFNEKPMESKSESEADELIDSFFRSTGYTEGGVGEYFDTRIKPDSQLQNFNGLVNHIRENVNYNEPFSKVEVISPYFSPGTNLFSELKDITGCDEISISLPFEGPDLVALDETLFKKTSELGYKWKAIKELSKDKTHRFNHSKIYRLYGTKKVVTIVGSVNFTEAAWKGVKQGGNYESAVWYELDKEGMDYLLKDYPLENLTFTGLKEEANTEDERADAFDLEFIIDWSAQTLEIINKDEESQKGKIDFTPLDGVVINKSKIHRLSSEHIKYLSNTPLIRVKPSHQNTYLYYYPKHVNIESKPLPEKINLSDAELLSLWQELDLEGDKNAALKIIDRFIDRITDESGDVKKDELEETSSTLNLMATHLSGLIKLQAKVFAKPRTIAKGKSISKMRDYYLFANNLDTLIGYKALLNKMAESNSLNNGFHWLLLQIIMRFFYKQYAKNFSQEISPSFDNVVAEFNNEIKKLESELKDEKLTRKHLNWAIKMLENDIK